MNRTTLILAAMTLGTAMNPNDCVSAATFGDDLKFLGKHTGVIVLHDASSQKIWMAIARATLGVGLDAVRDAFQE